MGAIKHYFGLHRDNLLGAVRRLAGQPFASMLTILVIATDIPTSARRPGVWRGVLHETTDQAAMFMPIVKEAIRVRAADEIGPALTRAAQELS